MGRTYLFLTKIGIDPKRLRCRQHMGNEMAHYASDCWDFEIQSSYGWIECVGCADRSAYDLTVHANKTKQKLIVQETLPEPKVVEKLECEFEMKKFGLQFRKDAKPIQRALEEMCQDDLAKVKNGLDTQQQANVTVDGQDFTVTPDLLKIESKKSTVHVREFTPNVIEPSFGIGRILYSLLEHSYWARESDVQRGVLSLPPIIAPVKCLIVPLSNNEDFVPLLNEISK